MFDTFPYEEWGEQIAEFWTWGPANSTGTYILTALGVAFMLISFIGFFRLENRKLAAQAAALRASGALSQPVATHTPEPGPPQAPPAPTGP